MQTWTTFDIEKLMGIKRNRLKEWIDRGFIKPSYQEETSTGMKSHFNKWRLYCVKMLETLIDNGVGRDQAGKWVEFLYRFDPEDKTSPEREAWRNEKNPPTYFILKKDSVGAVFQAVVNWGQGFQLKQDEVFVAIIINFMQIKNQVDMAID